MMIDSRFPKSEYSGWRCKMIHDFFDEIPNFNFYYHSKEGFSIKDCKKEVEDLIKRFFNIIFGSSYNIKRKKSFGSRKLSVKKKDFERNKNIYLNLFPKHKGRIHKLDYRAKYSAELVFFIFLNNVYSYLKFLEKNELTFVFILYPGGGFKINNSKSDNKLRAVCKSRFFGGVIVPNNFIERYLLDKDFCPEDKIYKLKYERADMDKSQIKKKKKSSVDKETFDISFVAYKYMEKGIDKGYDLFIDTAKKLSKKYSDMRFHVVGNFSEEDIDVSEIKDKVIFHGVKDTDFLIDFYSKTDIFLSPNRPFVLGEGAFDGFPLGGGHAQFCGVALFLTDELKLNEEYIEDEEIVIIKPKTNYIVDKIEFYYKNLDLLYKLSKKGQEKCHKIRDKRKVNKEFVDIFKNIMNEKK